jgi:uncharacterized protein YjaZ
VAYCCVSLGFIVIMPKYNAAQLENTFLHEIGHLFAFNKYGTKDIRWDDYEVSEGYANNFATRWLKRLKKEDWLNKYLKEKNKL